jgi:FHS family glucose/mannose:H+ symporter-like MFS transporter
MRAWAPSAGMCARRDQEGRVDEQEDRPISSRFRGLATVAVFASLMSYAVVLLITPACNNEIAASYHVSLGQLGELTLATMLGFFVTVIPAGRFADRRGKLPSMLAGCLAMTAGALLFAQTTDFRLAVVGTALFGIGGGLTEATSMALLADLYAGPRRTAMMNLSQAMFGVGAVVSPAGIGWLLRSGMSWRLGYVGAGAICAVCAGLNLAGLVMREERPVAHPTGGGPGLRARIRARDVARDPIIVWLALGILLYVGAEIGQSTWLSMYFKRYLGAADAFAASSPSFMWVGIGIGRVAGAWVSRHMSELGLICWATALAAVGQAVLLMLGAPSASSGSAASPGWGAAATFALGLFLGPIFPTVISRASAAYPRGSGVVTAIVGAAGSLGAVIFPPTIGWIGDSIGLRTALWICVVVLCADLAVFMRMRAGGRVH